MPNAAAFRLANKTKTKQREKRCQRANERRRRNRKKILIKVRSGEITIAFIVVKRDFFRSFHMWFGMKRSLRKHTQCKPPQLSNFQSQNFNSGLGKAGNERFTFLRRAITHFSAFRCKKRRRQWKLRDTSAVPFLLVVARETSTSEERKNLNESGMLKIFYLI